MAWLTHRDGAWSVASGDVSSPWHDGGAQTAANRVPRGGAGDAESGDGTAGDPVVVEHALTVDGPASCGNSLPAAPWGSSGFKAGTGGLFPTNLPTGEYRMSYFVRSPYGSTAVGQSETAPVSIINGFSRPRALFSRPPLSACSHVIVLTEAGGAAGTGRVYCYDVTSAIVDLRSELWNNVELNGGTSHEVEAKPFAAAPSPPSVDEAAALVIESTGRLIFADGSLLTIRGDWVIKSSDGSTADWVTFRGSGDYVFNSSLSTSPANTAYRVVWQGHGNFAWVAP